MKKLAHLVYKVLKPFIEVEWSPSFEQYGTVFKIRIFGQIVSEVLYSPDMHSLREKWEKS